MMVNKLKRFLISLLMTEFLNQLVYRTMRSLIPIPGIRDDNVDFFGLGREAGAFRIRFDIVINNFYETPLLPSPDDPKSDLSS